MHNFFELMKLTEKDSDSEKLHATSIYLHDTDSILWKGYPHIYANMRVVLEAISDFIIEKDIGIKVHVVKKQYMSYEDLKDYIDKIENGNLKYEELYGKEFKVKEGMFALEKKIKLVEGCFDQADRSLKNWGLIDLKDVLNKHAHCIKLPRDLSKGFQNRFNFMKLFHDTIYKGFIEMHYPNVKIKDYIEPRADELVNIVKLYNNL